MIAKRDGIFLYFPIGGIMKKYLPKYRLTHNESLDSDEVFHLMSNLRKYENRRELLRMIPIAILIALGILYLLVR